MIAMPFKEHNFVRYHQLAGISRKWQFQLANESQIQQSAALLVQSLAGQCLTEGHIQRSGDGSEMKCIELQEMLFSVEVH